MKEITRLRNQAGYSFSLYRALSKNIFVAGDKLVEKLKAMN